MNLDHHLGQTWVSKHRQVLGFRSACGLEKVINYLEVKLLLLYSYFKVPPLGVNLPHQSQRRHTCVEANLIS